MALNVLEYAKIFMEELDRQLLAGATSGWMEANAGQVKYSGGNEVKIPIITMDGMADYDRDEGFTQGAVKLQFQTHTLTMDRGRTFQLDVNDVDETNFAAAAGNVMAEFQRTKVIPEIDAYRYSKLAAIAIEAGNVSVYTPSTKDILKQINDDLYKIWNVVGDNGIELVITMSIPVSQILNSSAEVVKKLDVTDFAQGEIKTKVQAIDGTPILKTPSARMYTEYLFKSGEEGQKEGGFEKTETAKAINYIITARRAPIAVSKTDTPRIFDPMTNQRAHAWKIDYRKYHDLWVKKNQVEAVRVCLQEA